MTNGASASSGLRPKHAPSSWRSSIITERHYGDFLAVVHPGGVLADELEELGMSARELARQINVPANRITQIINGRRGISGDTALRLGHWFGTGPQIWLNLQSLYELNLARSQVGHEIAKLPRRELSKEAAE